MIYFLPCYLFRRTGDLGLGWVGRSRDMAGIFVFLFYALVYRLEDNTT